MNKLMRMINVKRFVHRHYRQRTQHSASTIASTILWFATLSWVSPLCVAQTNTNTEQNVTGPLITLINSNIHTYNQLERLSAHASQAAYNQLTNDPDGSGPLEPICNVTGSTLGSQCIGTALLVFQNTRELIQTANELLGSGPIQYSLQLDPEGLGFALRWTAAEELSSQSTVSRDFANAQIASLMSRINALRVGARGFSVTARLPTSGYVNFLTANSTAVSNIDSTQLQSPWGGFINGSFNWGERAPTELEDAFSLNGDGLIVGADYRFSEQFVLGGLLSYNKQSIDFDATRSIVEGGIESKGLGLTLYALGEWAGPYVSGALGTQQLSIDSTRIINYPSFNIFTESVYATARGTTHSNTLTATLSAGWPLTLQALGVEPFVRGEYLRTHIAGFQERSINNYTGEPAGFDFAFDGQSITTFAGIAGIKIQRALSSNFGVLVPYLSYEYHHHFQDATSDVKAVFNGATNNAGLELPGDLPDSSFFIIAVGTTWVLPGGLQGFVQYRTVKNLAWVSQQTVTLGLRFEL